MSDKFNQLILKAMSTTSDNEALTCLKMAKKIAPETMSSGGTYNGETAEHWYGRAVDVYKAYKIEKDTCKTAVKHMLYYKQELSEQKERNYRLNRRIQELENKKWNLSNYFPIFIFLMMFLTLVIPLLIN